MTKFTNNDMFCNNCFLHDTFWSGGNSWGIDHCPLCGSYETILWENMSILQRQIAEKLFEGWWKSNRMSVK